MPRVKLHAIAFARSGDKGDVVNVGVMAKSPRLYPALLGALSAERVRAHFEKVVKGAMEIYPLPNLYSVNLVLRRALGGGATSTLRFDQTGKSMATAVLRMEVEVDDALLEEASRVTRNVAGEGRSR